MMKPMSLYSARVAGGGGKRRGEGGLQKVFTSLGAQEKLFVGGQAGAVREQHAHSDFAAARVIVVKRIGEKPPANSGTIAVTGASRSSRPRS